jgi:hypothetical protein
LVLPCVACYTPVKAIGPMLQIIIEGLGFERFLAGNLMYEEGNVHVVTATEPRTIRRVGHAAQMKGTRNGCRVLIGNHQCKIPFRWPKCRRCRSQWPRGLRHELSSLARTLRSWVRIPLIAWMSVLYAFILCVGRGCATGWSPVQGVLPTLYRIKKLKKRPRPNKGLQSHSNNNNNNNNNNTNNKRRR